MPTPEPWTAPWVGHMTGEGAGQKELDFSSNRDQPERQAAALHPTAATRKQQGLFISHCKPRACLPAALSLLLLIHC